MRVLVATDLSEAADDAVVEASRLASQAPGGPFAVCHVVPNLQPMNTLFPDRAGEAMKEVMAFEQKVGEAVRLRVSELTGRSADSFELFVEMGNPHASIIECAETWRADVVVVGSQGSSSLAHALLGGVAEMVVRYAHSRVLVVRNRKGGGGVLVGTDLSDASMSAVRAAAAESKRLSVPLTVVYAIDFAAGASVATAASVFGAPTVALPEATQREIREAARTTLTEMLKGLGAAGTVRVEDGAAASVIVTVAEAIQADLVVVGTHGRTGLKRVALGSAAEKIVRTAPCSVLVVRVSQL